MAPVDMLALRPIIDDRRNQPNPTILYQDLYQTSQNPVFNWFTSYDSADEGAWRLTLSAVKGGELAQVSICIHTPQAACAPLPPASGRAAVSRALACAAPGGPSSQGVTGSARTR